MKAKQQVLMAANASLGFQDAMDRIWFHRNILFLAPTGLDLPAMKKMTTSSETQNSEPVPRCNSHKPKYKNKRPTTLVLGLREPPTGVLRSCPSFPTTSSDLKRESRSDRRRSRRRRAMSRSRSYRSVTELENYEVKGFMDLGFVFRKEELSMEIMNIIPGLQRLGKEGRDDEASREEEEEDDEGVERPYLSEAWMRHDLSVVSPSLQPRSPYGADMKRQLRFWAREVASVIHHKYVKNL
ncbi:uncharacterized protein LOC103972892 [Musa acuminata AAA Group]|uniref:uncharacterized protein LOC103972892 n=1 Tax=Musa acuminata AAA Group TaxID=214697 RepID=UPI0031CFF714